MVWGAALYLRRRPVLAGVVIAVGACAKEVAPYVLVALALLEVLRWWRLGGGTGGVRRSEVGAGVVRWAACAIAAAGSFIGLLAVLDRVAPPYADASHQLVGGGAFSHIGHILSYAAQETSPHGPTGIASYPWQWLFDYKPIAYLSINPSRPVPGLYHVHPTVHFLGMISPPILLAGLVGVVVAAGGMWRGRWRWRGDERTAAQQVSDVGVLSVAWFLGTFVPFELLSVAYSRTSYLYYMLVVMPGLYLGVAYLIERFRPGGRLVAGAFAAVAAAAVIMYPFTPLPF
jgi:hypothetical protein